MFGIIASIAGPLLGAAISSDATSSAADTQAQATNAAAQTQLQAQREAIAEQKRQFELNRSDLSPYRSAGSAALRLLSSGVGLPSQPQQLTQGNFDAQAYLAQNPDVAKSGMDPWQHYQQYGLNEGRAAQTLDDRNNFDAKAYLKNNPDVAAAGVEPYQHYLQYGKKEGRAAPGLDNQVLQTSGSNIQPGDLTRKFSVADFWSDPVVQLGYQSGLDLGTKALRNAAPLTTGLDSGAALKELTRFGTDYTGRTMAAPSQQRFVDTQTNQYNKLAGMAGIGQTATNAGVNAGTNAANSISSIYGTTGSNIAGLISGQGNASAAARIAGANAWGGGLQSISNYWQQQNLLDRLQNRPRAGGSWNSPNLGEF